MSAELRPLLMIGLKRQPQQMTHPEEDKITKWNSANLKQAAEEQTRKLKELGFDPEMFFFDETEDKVFDIYKSKMRERQWAGVSIGWGIRGTVELTASFEKLVNIAVEEVQPAPKLMFAVQPDQMVEAVSRAFQV